MSESHRGDPESIEGIWLGTLKGSGFELRIVFNISTGPDARLTATIDSPDQGAKGIPVTRVSLEKGVLHLEIKDLKAVFEGTMKTDPLTIDGEWRQGIISVPLVLRPVDKVEEIRRPQDPKKPYPYAEEEVFYENDEAGIKLAGTLTLPGGKGPYPAAILISGSGQQDRNETVFNHRPFLVMADYLTKRGIAVLRVDDRGVGKSAGSASQATSSDFAGDVLAGVAYLNHRKEIHHRKIGLVGHSEGGLIAPMVASESADVSFIVLMAGPGLTGEEILYRQQDLVLKAMGTADEEIDRKRANSKRIFAILKQENDNAVAERKIRTLGLPEDELSVLDISLKRILSPWFRLFLTYDPAPTLQKVTCPVLAINGEKDLQVAPEENLHAIERALKAGGNRHFTIKALPGLNHLFQTAETGSPAEYQKIEETMSPLALKIIGDWILEQTGPK